MVSGGNDRRERRKEVRSVLNDVNKRIETLHQNAIKYFMTDPVDTAECEKLALGIIDDMDRLSTLVSVVLPGLQKTFKNASGPIRKFRQAVTGGNFQSKARAITPPTDPLYAAIANAEKQLIVALEQTFASSYKR